MTFVAKTEWGPGVLQHRGCRCGRSLKEGNEERKERTDEHRNGGIDCVRTFSSVSAERRNGDGSGGESLTRRSGVRAGLGRCWVARRDGTGERGDMIGRGFVR